MTVFVTSQRFDWLVVAALRVLLAVLVAMVAAGCAHSSRRPVENGKPSPPQPIAVAAPKLYSEPEEPGEICTIDPSACPELDRAKESTREIKEEIYAVQQVSAPGPLSGAPAISGNVFGVPQAAAPPTPPAPIKVGQEKASRAEMIDVEARVELEVDRVSTALDSIRAIVKKTGGRVVNEVVEDKPSSVGAALSLRVPTAKALEVIAALEGVGKLLSRKVESKDIGREYHDAQILARNLDATLRRYEELLKAADDPDEMLAIEQELSRVRSQLDRVQGDIRYLADRASRATIYVTLSALGPDPGSAEPVTKLHLGVRSGLPLDFSDAQGTRTFAGGGISILFSRTFSFDADWATRLRDSDGIQLFLGTVGGDLYSDRLGGGRRDWLNPYVGLRLGYARLLGEGAFALGGTLGVEIWKSEAVLVGIETRIYALLGLDDGTHALVQPAATLHVAY